MLMLLPPHTTTTTGPPICPASFPSFCSLARTPLYTAARAAPQAGSTRIFSSSAGGGESQLCWSSWGTGSPRSALTYETLHSRHRFLVRHHLGEDDVFLDQSEGLRRHPGQAERGGDTKDQEKMVAPPRTPSVNLLALPLPGDFR